MELTQEEEQKIREDAYNGIEEAPEQTAAEETDVQPEPETDDPWSGVPPALKEQIEMISGKLSAIDVLEGRLKQAERRVGSIQNEFYNAQKAAKKVEDAPSKEDMERASKSKEAWEGLKNEFPDWAEAIEGKIAESAKTPNIDEIRQQIGGLSEGINQFREQVITNDALERRLVGLIHPNYQATIKSPEYQSWIRNQPADIQHKAENGQTADEAIDVLNRFKEFKTKAESEKSKKQTRLSQAVDLPKGPKTRQVKSEADMSEDEYRQQLQKELWG